MNKTNNKINNKNVQFEKNDVIKFGNYPQNKVKGIFKVQPIKWRILDINNGEALILSEKILDARIFDKKTNNYKNSEIRKWLNEDFYNQAFNEDEKLKIITTNVDNTAISTNPNNEPYKWCDGSNPNICENTNDKVFLLSEQEVTNELYGFNSNILENDIVRKKFGTAYAKSHGLSHHQSPYAKTHGFWEKPEYKDGHWWWLRSPGETSSSCARSVYIRGKVNNTNYVYLCCDGVVPALKIKLDNEIKKVSKKDKTDNKKSKNTKTKKQNKRKNKKTKKQNKRKTINKTKN